MMEGSGRFGLSARARLMLAVGLAVVAVLPFDAGHHASASSTDDWSTFHHDQDHLGVSPDTAIGASTASGLTQKWAQNVGTSAVLASPVVVFNTTLDESVAYDVTITGQVNAMAAASGTSIWTYNVAAQSHGSPAVDGNTLYVTTSHGVLWALNATTGALQCSVTLPIFPPQTKPGRIEDGPVIGHIDSSGPIVFFGDSGNRERTNAGHEWAFTGVGNTAGGCRQVWSFNGWGLKGASGTRTGSWSPPALTQDSTGRWLVVFGSSNPDDSVYALAASTGTEVWRYQTNTHHDYDVGAGPTISAPGVNGFADGVVYVDGKDQIEYALDLLTGSLIWSFNLAADSGLGTNSVSCAALVGNNVIVGYSEYLYDLNATTGALVWRSASLATGTTIFSSPAVSGAPGDQVAFIADVTGHENAYRVSDGTMVFSLTTGHMIYGSTAISDGMVFFGTGGGQLIALG